MISEIVDRSTPVQYRETSKKLATQLTIPFSNGTTFTSTAHHFDRSPKRSVIFKGCMALAES